MFRICKLLLVGCLLGAASAAAGEPPRRDLFSDPLPPGAVLRLGKQHSGAVRRLAFSPDGKIIASAAPWSGDFTVLLWDAATGRLLHPLRGHRSDVCWLAFGPDGRILATGGNDGVVNLWDPASGQLLRRHELPAARVH
jgi:WD40 repeat protein